VKKKKKICSNRRLPANGPDLKRGRGRRGGRKGEKKKKKKCKKLRKVQLPFCSEGKTTRGKRREKGEKNGKARNHRAGRKDVPHLREKESRKKEKKKRENTVSSTFRGRYSANEEKRGKGKGKRKRSSARRSLPNFWVIKRGEGGGKRGRKSSTTRR